MRFLKWTNLTLFLAIVILGAYVFLKQSETIQFPFRCQGVTEYHLGAGNDEAKFTVNQDLRLEKNARSYFLVIGHVLHDKQSYNINRTFELSDGVAVDKDTVIFRLDGIAKSSSDNTPDVLFNRFSDEVIFEPGFLQLDIVYLEKKAWLVGQPMQFLFACARY